MAKKNQLRELRLGTTINENSKRQEKEVIQARRSVEEKLKEEFAFLEECMEHKAKYYNKDIVAELQEVFPDEEFFCERDDTFIAPDGGFLGLRGGKAGRRFHPILISEVKHQGTNDLRAKEGKKKQARGNAIERLGKNVLAISTLLSPEEILPFICFGYGCDFEEDSSIRDRVVSIAKNGKLNKIYLHKTPAIPEGRGSYFFREDKWSVEEMANQMFIMAKMSVENYINKYGEDYFTHADA